MNDYHVRIADDTLAFSAAHFITLENNTCEPLHGHNYRVAAEVFGPLGENQYVVDFLALRDALLAILRELDHCVLLPTEHTAIQVMAARRRSRFGLPTAVGPSRDPTAACCRWSPLRPSCWPSISACACSMRCNPAASSGRKASRSRLRSRPVSWRFAGCGVSDSACRPSPSPSPRWGGDQRQPQAPCPILPIAR